MCDRMVDRLKVISDLEEQIAWIRDNDFHKFPGWGHAVLAMRDALALLKEQEPVEPIPTKDDDWICGACNNSVVGTEELDEGGFVPIRFNYCPNCGQAVKWE